MFLDCVVLSDLYSVQAVCIAGTSWTGGLVFGLAGIPGVIDISDIIHSFDNDKSKFYFTVSQ